MRRAVLLLLLFAPALFLATSLPPGARAAAAESGVAAADRAAIREVIEAQIDAFRHDDAAGAFGFASPTIRRQFGTAEIFLRMVQTGYRPVYRPREVEFLGLEPAEDGDGLVQHVLLIGPDGQPVEALYLMQRQPDGNWRINGCILTQSNQKTT
jgi:ketosteroid isomerase-like protein